SGGAAGGAGAEPHRLDAERDPRQRGEAPPGADRAVRRTARRAGRGERRHRQGRRHQPAARRAHLPPPARKRRHMIVLNIPNLITLSRIVLIPLLIGIYYLPGEWLTDGEKDVIA